MKSSIIVPEWDIPKNVKALLTTRQGGYSQTPYDCFNLATHVDDHHDTVIQNRQKLAQYLPAEPLWLNQVHSNTMVNAHHSVQNSDADGSYSDTIGCVCAVMTADCLPVLICNHQATVVAAVHAGWRGLLNGILEQAINKVLNCGACQAGDVSVYLGAAIGAEKFEVGDDVRQAFLQHSTVQEKEQTEACFIELPLIMTDKSENKYLADIYQLARIRLSALGIENISGGNYCTYTEHERFFSYRRDGITGRMASLIWLESR